MFKYFSPLIIFVLGCGLLLTVPGFYDLALTNTIAQLVLFAAVVCIPAYMTGRLSYVDIGWPLGVALIGLLTLLMAPGDTVRVVAVSFVYLFVGLRMGLGAVMMWRKGAFKVEFPRYQYQRLRWEKSGKTNTMLAIQVDALMQGMANASFLAFPAIVISFNQSSEYSLWELAGLVLWVCAFIFENIADKQKNAFMRDMKRQGKKKQVCNVGLWRYSRHPNYFAEWMVWNALVIASVPSFMALYDSMAMPQWLLVGAGLLYTSYLFYNTLVYFTGAVPAEYYSALKRPEYKRYQAETNRFFPGPHRAPRS